jgi:hypothetical protein
MPAAQAPKLTVPELGKYTEVDHTPLALILNRAEKRGDFFA